MSTKDQLLILLKEGRGNWVSGELLGSRMAISRSAIWKHMCALKEEGYVIESSRKKGYILRQIPDSLLAHEIGDDLNTKTFGKKGIFYFKETTSTNIIAEQYAKEGVPEGALVIAEKQTHGKGRRGRSWFSPAGEGVYMSIILRPPISPNEAPKLTLIASVATAETLLCLTSSRITIKWPNDVLINEKKVAGILTEISAEIDKIHHVIVGIGVNVNTPEESFPSDIKDRATSIFVETGEHISRVKVVQTFLERFEKRYEQFKSNGFQSVMLRWKQLTDMIGKNISVGLIDNTSFTGEVVNIDEDGFLLLKDNEGTLHKVVSGDVTVLNQQN